MPARRTPDEDSFEHARTSLVTLYRQDVDTWRFVAWVIDVIYAHAIDEPLRVSVDDITAARYFERLASCGGAHRKLARELRSWYFRHREIGAQNGAPA